jgi:hypothetical protein
VCSALSHPHISFKAQPTNHRPLGSKGQTKKPSRWFWDPNHQTVAAGFEIQTEKPEAIGFEAKSEKTVLVILRPNHWQTVDFGFEAQPTNSSSSSTRVRCKSHTVSPDLSIIQPLSTWPIRPSPILYISSPTSIIILIAVRHAAPATRIPRDNQTRFSKQN